LGGAQFGDAQEISIAGIGANEEIQVNIADVDFNGWPDLIVNDSYNTTLLHNTGQGNFVRGDYQFASGWAARVFLTDMDGDGDIDLIKLGNDNYHQGQCFYYNNRSISLPGQNGAPTTIAGLQVYHLANSTTLSWAPSTDDSTPSALISYHVKVIDGNGKHWVHPETNATGTFRRRLDYGNAGFRTSFTINDLPAGNYTAHIQAVDATFKLSGASTINFQITAGPNSLSVERILLNKVKLVWTDGPLNGSATVVARKSKHSDFQVIAELSGNATTFTDEGLEYDDVYTYHVYEKSAAITTAPSNSVTWNTTLLVLEQSTITNATGSLDVGDYTNDGKMDMLIFGGRIFNGIEVGLTNALLEKVPTGWTQHAAGAPTIPDAGTSVFYDINGDHLIDLYQHGFIYSASKYETNVLLNNGNKTFSSATNIFTADDVGILEVWDYDRDNDLDFYVTQPGQPNSLIKNNAEGAFVADTKQSACCDRSIVPGDYDNDGDEDIVHFDRTSNNFTLLLNTEKSLVPNTNFPVSGGRMQKLDYNGDGFPDLLFLADNAYDAKSKLFKNQGPDAEGEIQFKLIRDNFPTGDVTVNTADYDHDGDLDIFFTGTPCVMYNNLGDDDFKETKLLNFSAGANNTKWVDFDGDGDLDLFMTGYFKVNHADNVDNPFAFILNNQLIVSGTGVENLPPAAPVNLTSSQDTEGLHLSWTGQPDDHTAMEALTHDVVLYKDGKELMKVPANPTSGARLKLQDGRAAGRLTIDNLAYGDYTWKVQAIDQTFLGSPLSLQGQFTFIPQAPMMNDTVIYQCDREISLVAPGTNIEWYSDQALTDKIGEGAYSPEASQTVYVTQTVAGRRGVARAVKITIEARPPMPIASVDPYFYCENNAGGPANLAVAGTDIKWYKDAGGNVSAGSGNQLSIVLSEQILYATQTISQCESLPATIMVKPVVITSDVHFGDGEIYTDEQDADFYQWYKNNSPLADANDYLLDDIEDGATYKVYIEKGACSETSTPTVITGIEDRVDSHLKIFPNPASGSFTIEMDKPGGVITIYDVAGRIVFEAFGNTSRQIISSSSWSRGLYYVTIHFGQTIVCKKVVIN
ncbi:MAG TPA: FG-GAP-like repeat-containing protein, partial [Chryseolinea sp.]